MNDLHGAAQGLNDRELYGSVGVGDTAVHRVSAWGCIAQIGSEARLCIFDQASVFNLLFGL